MSDCRVKSAWAVCDDCLLSIEIRTHPDNEMGSLPPESEWDATLTCPVCGEWLTPDEVTFADA